MYKRTFIYPGSDIDRSRNMLAMLGSFWSRIYFAKDQLASYADSTATLVAQTYRNILETVAAVSRFDVPVFHSEYWVPIVIKKSDINGPRLVNNFFDGNADKFDQTTAVFDGVAQTELFYAPAPKNLASVGQIFNKIIFPTVALLEHIDYIIDTKSNAVVFAANPFDNPAILKRAAVTNGQPDEEILLWGFCGQFDYNYVFEHFAYAIGIQLKSSQGYKDLMNAVFNGLINGGASSADLDLAFSAICGIPVVLDNDETVEVVDSDTRGVFISTDKNLYRFAATAVPTVIVGQKLNAGAQLVLGFEIDEFFVGSTYGPPPDDELICCPAPNLLLSTNAYQDLLTETDEDLLLDPNLQSCSGRKALSALSLDRGFLSACFYGDLVFENKEVPVHVDTNHVTNYTYVSFPVVGLPADVERFFDEIHYRGILAAQAAVPCPPGHKRHTLAQWLDRRKNPLSEPEEAHLPKTINPLKFVVENVLRNNIFVVRINISALGQNRLGLYNIRHLRQLLPPGTAMLLVFELNASEDRIRGDRQLRENTHFFTGMAPVSDTISDQINDLGVTVRLISGTCQ